MDEHKLKTFLMKNNLKISLAESCTGGLICSFITNIDGASNFFEQGFVTYSDESKIRLLGVNKETMEKYGAVSEQVAKEMAIGLVGNWADVALATTGIVGPTGGTKDNPIGTVYIGMAYKKDPEHVDCRVIKYHSDAADRVERKRDMAQRAFLHLCKFLQL